MIVAVNGVDAHAATGGVELTGSEPVVLLIHGAGMDSTVWQLQTRYLAHRGLSAVAVDLPGHGRSAGPALTSVAAMADWTARFVAAAEFHSVHVVGHSMGTFIALEIASRNPAIVDSITLCGTAAAMPVHPDLLAAADNDVPAAAALMAAWSLAKPAHIGSNPTPGLWMLGGVRALVENSAPGVLATDLRACIDYDNALAAAAMVKCAATVIIGLGDKMTPPKSGRALAAALTAARIVELANTGHMMMAENPRGVKQTILDAVTTSGR